MIVIGSERGGLLEVERARLAAFLAPKAWPDLAGAFLAACDTQAFVRNRSDQLASYNWHRPLPKFER
jgi:hypothetical protein